MCSTFDIMIIVGIVGYPLFIVAFLSAGDVLDHWLRAAFVTDHFRDCVYSPLSVVAFLSASDARGR